MEKPQATDSSPLVNVGHSRFGDLSQPMMAPLPRATFLFASLTYGFNIEAIVKKRYEISHQIILNFYFLVYLFLEQLSETRVKYLYRKLISRFIDCFDANLLLIVKI